MESSKIIGKREGKLKKHRGRERVNFKYHVGKYNERVSLGKKCGRRSIMGKARGEEVQVSWGKRGGIINCNFPVM